MYKSLLPALQAGKQLPERKRKAEYQEEHSQMIYWRHKTGRYAGPYTATVEASLRAKNTMPAPDCSLSSLLTVPQPVKYP